jgi:tetratricopeptide (TPR) repeat protein
MLRVLFTGLLGSALAGSFALGANEPEGQPAPRPLRGRPLSRAELPTTSARIFVNNRESQFESLTRLASGGTTRVDVWAMLGAIHHQRGICGGDVEEIQRGIEWLDRCLKIEPSNATLWTLHASWQLSLHRIGQSRRDVQQARSLGPDVDGRIAAVEQELDWNSGRYDVSIAAIRAAAAKRPTMETLTRLAQLEHELGRFDDAARAHECAEDLIPNPDPLAVAWLNVQRGHQKLELGEYAQATRYFREAVERLPSYVPALEHLGESLHFQGQDLEAISVYELAVKQSPNPEFKGALAAVRRARGDVRSADRLASEAALGFERLHARFPEAMAAHASEFFLGEGRDPAKALKLAREDLELRPTSASWFALAKAQVANGLDEEARGSIARALAMPVMPAGLRAMRPPGPGGADEVVKQLVRDDARRSAARRPDRRGESQPESQAGPE